MDETPKNRRKQRYAFCVGLPAVRIPVLIEHFYFKVSLVEQPVHLYQVLRVVTSISEEWLKQTFDQIKKRYRGTTRKKQLELNFMPRFHWNGCVNYSTDRMFVRHHTVAKSLKIVISSLPLIYLLTSAKMMLKVLYCRKAMEAIQVKRLLNTLFSKKHYFVKHYRTTLLVASCMIFLKVQSVDFHDLEEHCDWST